MSYYRVLPRDLFNEAKLLKGLGRIICDIHDEKLGGLAFEHYYPNEGFVVEQDRSTGNLMVTNLTIWSKHPDIDDATPVYIECRYNAKDDHWPIVFYTGEDDEQHAVFDEDGDYSDEFQALCTRVRA